MSHFKSPGRLSAALPARPVRRAAGWALVALLLSLALGPLPNYQGWDVTYYLAQTSSLAEDGDLDLRNDLLHVQGSPTTLIRHFTRVYANGALINNRPIGPSTLWLPAYALSLPLRAIGEQAPSRWPRPQLAALQLFSMALMVWLFWVLDRWLRRMGVRRWLAALCALALVVGTPLVIYGFRGFRGSHLLSTVAVMWLVLTALRLARRPTAVTALMCGVATGLVFLCRWQDLPKAVVLVIPAIELWRQGFPVRRGLKLAAVAAAGAAAVGALQLHAWALERGEVLGLPQGGNYLRLADPELGRFLLSGLSGLLPWSPLFAIGLVGLLLPWRCRLPASWRWLALAILVFDVYLNASVADWWGGASYGARRMCSDVPFLALGLGNLALFRRPRVPVAVLLAACCLWGLVTSNLFTHGLRDLGLVFAGRPSDAPGAEREGGAQPSPAEARALALGLPVRYLAGNYFPGAGPAAGRFLTAIVMALVVLLTAWGLTRARPPNLLAVALLASLAIVLFAHARLLADGRGDPAERLEWKEMARAARGRSRPAARLEPDIERLLAAPAGDLGDARRILWIFALREQGRTEEARSLAAGLDGRGYPFLERLERELTRGPEDRLLLDRWGRFFEVGSQTPTHTIVVNRKVDLPREAVHLGLEIQIGRVTAGTSRPLLAWGRRGEESLAEVIAVGEDNLLLRTASARTETEVPWRSRQSYGLELDWLPRQRSIELTVTTAGAEPARIAAAAPAVHGAEGHLELRFGAPIAGDGHEPPWQTRYSSLWVTAGPPPPQISPEPAPEQLRRPRRRRLRGPNRRPPPPR